MSADKLSAYFPGLVDVCLGDEGQPLFLVIENWEILLKESAETSGGEVVPPDTEHFPYTVPRATEVMKHIGIDDKSLYSDVLAYLKRFSALDDNQWAVVAHYVFLTYLHDHQDIRYCPMLLFYAVPERGKSRTGKSVAFLAFRGIHLSELREANILRCSQHLHATLFFDLMDAWKKAEKKDCEDLILGRFEKGPKVSRVLYPDKGAFRDTVYYDIYGPTIIASNEQLHKILDTRCLPIVMPNRPGNYENPRPELALELKERLTAWRAKFLSVKLPEIKPIDEISGRLWDITKPLFQVGSLVNPQGFILLMEAILSISGERSESKRESTEGHLIGIIKDLSAEHGLEGLPEWTLKTSDILTKFNKDRPADKLVTSQWIGKKLKSLSLRHRTVNGRSEIMLTSNEYWTIISQYGFFSRKIPLMDESPTQTLPEENLSFQYNEGVVESSRDSREPWKEKDFIDSLSPEEKEDFDERVAIMIADGRLETQDAEENAYIRIMRRRTGIEDGNDGGKDVQEK